MLSNGAGVHESLGDDGQNCVHVVRGLDIKNELRVLHDVDPKTQRKTEETGDIILNIEHKVKEQCLVLGVKQM